MQVPSGIFVLSHQVIQTPQETPVRENVIPISSPLTFNSLPPNTVINTFLFLSCPMAVIVL